MLIYLDSAQFSYLQSAGAPERSRFQQLWLNAGTELALSFHHLQEMAQLADQQSLSRRLAVLELFQRVRCRPATSALSLEFEIQVQLYELLGCNVERERSALDSLFPVASLDEIRGSTRDLAPLLRRMREPMMIAAKASNLTKGQRKPSFRKRIPQDDVATSQARALALESIEGEPPEVVGLTLKMLDELEAAVTRTGTVRSALEQLYGLNTVAARVRIPDSDLVFAESFFRTARTVAPRVAANVGAAVEHVLSKVAELDPYACPGFALQAAVRRARERHRKPDEPSDEIDVAHLSFAPYVDIFYADKRTLGFVHQEAEKSHGLLTRDAMSSIARVGTLEQLLERLERDGAERSSMV